MTRGVKILPRLIGGVEHFPCPACKAELPRSAFHGINKRGCYCKPCHRKMVARAKALREARLAARPAGHGQRITDDEYCGAMEGILERAAMERRSFRETMIRAVYLYLALPPEVSA